MPPTTEPLRAVGRPPVRAALYARFTTERQSSTADQLRVCERIAAAAQFDVVARFTDEAISGGTAERPGYQAMLAAIRAGQVAAIVAEDASRLWRNMAEQAPRLAELADLGVHVVTSDLDTRQGDTADWMASILGTANQVYRKEIARRTRRSMEGRAREQRPTGGRAYGYTTGPAIVPEQAAIVREIFERFADGASLRSIAADLNARGIAPPGAGWQRTTRRTAPAWMVSALHAMLKNEQYAGRLTWNKRRWVRSAADSRKRRPVLNPPSEWVTHERPDLRIVSPELFALARARLTTRASVYGPGPGGRPVYLLSGLLRCGVCGAAFVVAAHRPVRYACSRHRHGGPTACPNAMMVARETAEARLLGPVLDRLLSPDAVELAVATMQAEARAQAHQVSPPALAALDAELAQLEQLARAGALSQDTIAAARQRLQERRGKLVASTARSNVQTVLFGAERAYREAVRDMRAILSGPDVHAARAVLSELVGEVRLVPEAGQLWAEMAARQERLAVNWSGSGGPLWPQFRILVAP